MNKDAVLFGIIGLLVGVLLAGFIASTAVNNNMTGMMQMMGMRAGDQIVEEREGMHEVGMGMSMDEMMGGLEGKTGDAFDQAFIEEMIVHHQGAIEMAKVAQQNAKHNELKNLSDAIISAQTSEIEQMRTWKQNWGY